MLPDAALNAFLQSEPAIISRGSQNLSFLTSMHVGGPADLVLSPRDTGAFIRLLDFLNARGIRYRVIGNGTNLIASDDGFRGVIVTTGGIDRLSLSGEVLRAGAGVSLSRAANAAREAALGGIEELYGIPGTVGGALYMNAGAYGKTVADLLLSATVYHPESGEVSVRRAKELGFGYRTSRIMTDGWIILSAAFQLKRGDMEQIGARMSAVLAKRAASQPLGMPNAGSIFKRPCEGIGAGALIEAASLKGLAVGGAEVSQKHAGFIVNRGTATAADIRALINLIRERVKAHAGVTLACEVEFL